MKTAEEFLDEDPAIQVYGLKENHPDLYRFIKENMIDFAKMHCEEQAKISAEKAVAYEEEVRLGYMSYRKDIVVNKDSILNAYPLDNIK